MKRIALVGDYNDNVPAHVAIPRALDLARTALGVSVEWTWLGTEAVCGEGDARHTLAHHDGVWLVPGSPYRAMSGALEAVRHARESDIPFLGTCGGFQHAVIELARNVVGIRRADHAETSTAGSEDVIVPLACSLVEQRGSVSFTDGSRLAGIFGGRPSVEGYRCNYGVNADYRARLESARLRFTGFDESGDIRALELPSHRFFVGTLFQPERAALTGARHPLIEAFVRAVASERS